MNKQSETISLEDVYKKLKSEYNGQLWSDEFLTTHIDLRGDQIICWFELDEDDEGFEEKRDCTISFYDEVVRFLVDNFGEVFKYEDPRISDDYIDKNNFHGQYEIVLDDDGENPAVIAIWENEENEMKPRFNENKFGRLVKETWERYPAANGCTIHDCGDCFVVTNKNGTTIGQCKSMTEAETIAEMCSDEMKNKPFLVSEGNELTEEAILDAIPVDARDGLIDINEPDGSFGRYTWYVRFAPFSDEEAKEAADGIKQVTGRRTQVANFGKQIYVVIMDYPSRPTSESRKLVKEGAGAGYTVTIKDLKLGSILEKKYVKMKKDYESYWECQVEVMPGEYEIEASDYYNDFFWQEHEFGDTPTAKIDGGIATISYSTNSYDEDEAEDELRREVARRTMDVSFDYGWGWTHADLPREKIEADHVDASGEFYGSIDKLELNAPDLADAVNSGYQSTFNQGEDAEEDEDGAPVNEVSGWKLEDEDLTLVNSESDGDKLYIVKLWWGSGYMTDNYNAYAFSAEEALNHVVAYIEKHDPDILKMTDDSANDYLEELVRDGEASDEMEAEESPYFQESFLYVDATTEGAKKPHYIYAENLQIAEYPKDHDYPMSKDIKRADESYDPKGDDGRKRIMNALEEFRQVMWDDTKVDDEEDHDLRRAWFERTDKAISNAVQTYFKYTRI